MLLWMVAALSFMLTLIATREPFFTASSTPE